MYHPRLEGKHYDMGFHYGSIMKSKGMDLSTTIKLSKEQIKFGQESLKICEQEIPNICEEIRGLAEGLEMEYHTLSNWLLSMYGFGDIHGCTCFCYNDHGNVYLTRNSDMFTELKKTSESVLYRPEHGNTFLGHTASLVQIEDGMNEYGLAMGINFLMTKDYQPGLNTGLVVRACLEECKNVQEAVQKILHYPIASTQNFILADPTGDMAVVECSPFKKEVRRPKVGQEFLISSNHFVCESMQQFHANPEENWYRSNDRYQTVQKAFEDYKDQEKDIEWAERLLAGKFGFICQYEKKLNFDTLWSSVYDLTNLKIECAEGNPKNTKFKEDTRLAWGMAKKLK